MALYHFTVKPMSMATESAVHRAAYHARTQLHDDRNGKWTRDYADRGDHAWGGLFAPGKERPDWTHDRGKIWNKAEAAERQANGRPCWNCEAAVPNELSRKQQTAFITDFLREQYVRKGLIVDANLHSDYDELGMLREGADPNEPRNDHLHFLVAGRTLDGQEFSKTKTDTRHLNSKEQLRDWREQWARHGAKALHKAGFHIEAQRFAVGHLTLPEQRQAAIARGDLAYADSLDREPDMKQGAQIAQMEKRGKKTGRGDDRREIQARNEEREEIREQTQIIDRELERLQRQERGETLAPEPPALPRAVIFRQKARFDTWANARRADLQNRRLGAEGMQGQTHNEQRRELEQKQQGFYGPQLDGLHSEAAAITTRQGQGGRLRGMAYRVTGRAARDRQRADEIKAGTANIGQRKAEQVQALTARQQTQTLRLAARYAEADRLLERRIGQARAGREAEGWIPPEAREATTGQEIDREAGNSPVEGREAETGETTPENEQAPAAQPEAAQDGNSGAGQESTAKTAWTAEQRAAAIEAEYERQAQADRERGGNDNDPGREIE